MPQKFDVIKVEPVPEKEAEKEAEKEPEKRVIKRRPRTKKN